MPEPTQTAAVLRAVRDRLATPGRWTQGADARAADGHPVNQRSPLATQWSLISALSVENYRAPTRAPYAYQALRDLTTECETLEDWNDTPGRTHAEVLALLDSALQDVEGVQP